MPWSVVIMVISIVLIGTIGKIIKENVRARNLAMAPPPADLIASRDEVRALKERVAVLERLVTDTHGSIDLDRQIERLRAPSANAERE
jgi:competence protein ComGC